MKTAFLLILGLSYLLHATPALWIPAGFRPYVRRLAAAGFLLGALGHFGEAFVQVKETIANAKHETVQVASRATDVTARKRNTRQKRSSSASQPRDVESTIVQPGATIAAR